MFEARSFTVVKFTVLEAQCFTVVQFTTLEVQRFYSCKVYRISGLWFALFGVYNLTTSQPQVYNFIVLQSYKFTVLHIQRITGLCSSQFTFFKVDTLLTLHPYFYSLIIL